MEPPTQKSSVDVVVIALGEPLLVGLYKDGRLIKRFEREGKTSEALPPIFEEILQSFSIRCLFYARGPGSFMAIKLSYIFLKTLQIAYGFEFFGCEGFTFNKNRPIKAMGNLYFVKENGKIATKKVPSQEQGRFELPQTLSEIECSKEVSPLYVLPAV